MKITPLLKGLIAGVLMVGVNLLLLNSNKANTERVQYLFYLMYAGAIAWTLIAYSRSEGYNRRFGSIFNQGFRCFIIITIVSVVFSGVYASRPGVKEKALEEYAKFLKEDKDSSKTPAEKEEMVKDYDKQFVTGNVSLALFGSLMTGAVFTAAGAGLLLMRKQ